MASSKAVMDSFPHSVARPDPEVNPNADSHPSMCKSYFLSPLETILESLDDYDWEYISCHDITEAYNVLSMRIRAIAPSIVHIEQPSPALISLKEHAIPLAQALKRDIRRALSNPSHNLKLSTACESWLSDISMTDHDIQHTIDLSTLCHFSLRVLSDIFAFRVLYLLFPGMETFGCHKSSLLICNLVQDLNELFHEVLKIASATELTTPNATKTVSLVFWIIQSQRLPPSILEPRKIEIVSVLRHALNGQRGLQAKYEVECRLQACNALSGLVLAKFRSPDFPHQAISQEIHAFLKPQIPPKDDQTLSREKFPLHYYLVMAFDSESSGTKDPVWAIITLISLIVLSDRWLYTRVDFRFFANTLFPAFVHSREEVKQLAIAAWGGLVWAFTLLPATHSAWRQPEDPDLPDASLGIRGRAFRFLKDHVKGEKGLLLVRGLLLPQNGGGSVDVAASLGDVSRALLVIKAMVGSTQTGDYEAGVQILSKLAGAIELSRLEGGKRDDIRPNLDVFESMLLEAGFLKVKDVARHVSTIRLDYIRVLSEAEVQHNWTALVETWVEAVERTFAPPIALPRGLLNVWQSLLLVKADLTQGHRHLTAPGAFASQIAGIVNRFLVHSQDILVQVQRLIAVKRLWSVMKNVFATSWLPAERILASVLEINFFLEEEHVKAAWSNLCSDLISVGIPTLLHVLSTGSEGPKVTRQLWTILARMWQVSDEAAHWEELVSLLVIPLRSWVMLGTEVELWEGVLRSLMSMAYSNSVGPFTVVDRSLRRLGDDGINGLVAFPQGLSAFMTYLDLSGCTELPQNIIAVIDRTLFSNYPPRAELLAACLEIIRHLGKMITSVPRTLLVQLLCAAERGICCWIGDEKATMLTREHDVVVQEVYCSTLGLLRELPPSLETLVAISPFLSSAFGRLSSSAIGPLTFNAFWRATYHGIEEYQSSYPDCLRACLLGYSDAFGGSIAEGLSMSQGMGSSSIPDSQPFRLDCEARLSCVTISREEWQPSPVQPPSSLEPNHKSPEPPVKRRRLDSSAPMKEIRTSSESPTSNRLDHEQSLLHSLPERIPLIPPPLIQNHNVYGESSYGLSTPRMTPQLPPSTNYLSRKRFPEIVSEAQLSKRRRTESDLDPNRPILQGMSGDLSTRRRSGPLLPQVTAPPEALSLSPPTASAPLAARHPADHVSPSPEVPCSDQPPLETCSQNTDTRKRRRVADWVNSFKAPQNSGPRGSASQVSSSGSGPNTPMRPSAATRASTPTTGEEEYDTWEAGAASLQEIMELQKELVGSDNFVPETDEEKLEVETEHGSDIEDFLGGSQLVTSGSKLQPRRSQTVPKRPASTPLG
ncbi:hypothetical protein C0989_005611 [Termitomyces sp. Mn162]|nr:hypothetical protein C0989_005611 [Termitomyces sp. Mn162]